MDRLVHGRLGLWLAALLVPLIILFLWLDPFGIRQDLTIAVLSVQRELHRDLAQVMRDVGADKAFAGWVLIGLGFVYGVFHAVGPGHGKIVIGTYLATQDQPLGRGLLLANGSALMQGLVALAAVGTTVWLFGQTARDANATANQLELVSYGLVVLIGLFLCFRAVRGLFQRKTSSCGHDHGAPRSSAGFWGTMVSTGIRPCSGGILVLVLGSALGLWWHGMAAVLAMSAGTGLTVSILAVLAIHARGAAQRLALSMEASETRMAAFANLVALTGGVLIIGFGISLIDGALSMAEHPLMRGVGR